MKKFNVSEQITVNGSAPITITYRHVVLAETAEEACNAIEGDWGIIGTDFVGYPRNLSPTDSVMWLHRYSAKEVTHD